MGDGGEMSRFRGKRKEDYASEGDSEGQAPSKKASKKDSSDESTEDIVVCEVHLSLHWRTHTQLYKFASRDVIQMVGCVFVNGRYPRIGE